MCNVLFLFSCLLIGKSMIKSKFFTLISKTNTHTLVWITHMLKGTGFWILIFLYLSMFFVALCRGKPTLLNMGSLIIKPVQRIMKYPLLLGELWQSTPEEHPDHRPLQEAFTAAKIINININEFKRRKDIGTLQSLAKCDIFRLFCVFFCSDLVHLLNVCSYEV